uniref:Transthyretin-like family-containing protein n=1 Tax=Strongyloides venezuelensis TaxID=75913 RepID=A0A0K0F4H4_STRVS
MCGDIPDSNVKLSLCWKFFISKSLLTEQFTNRKGQFSFNVLMANSERIIMKLAISIVLFNIFNILQCYRLIHYRPRNVVNTNTMLNFSGTLMCKGVPDNMVKISLGCKNILKSFIAKEFPNRRGQFFFNVRKNQCRIGSYFLLIEHHCKIFQPKCFIRFFIPLNIGAYIKNSKNSYNLNYIDLVKHYNGQQFLCSKQYNKVFNRN